jgi:hypothetical protein
MSEPDAPEGGQGGQVSEAENLRSEHPDTEIAPDQAVAGAPDGESGDADEGPTGPNARTGQDDRTQR